MKKAVIAISLMTRGLLTCLLLTLCSCTQAEFALVNGPVQFDDVSIIHDVAYGPKAWQKLDIYLPSATINEPLDVLVFFYGGRWSFGSKSDYQFVGSAFASKNFIVVIPDYSKYPQAHFPAFVQDGAKALSWTYDHIADYGGNPARTHISGHSAGAHIAALLTADANYLRAEGKNRSSVIHDFAGLAGPYDFTPDEPDLEDMFGPPTKYPLMQVTTYIDGKQPPMLLLYGNADKDVKAYNLERLEQRIRKKGGCEQSIIYPGADHIGIIAALSWINPQEVPVLQDMVKFFGTTHAKCGVVK